MKLKLRIDPDDLLIFGVFAIFLLYIVALIVVNISSFASDAELAGLNPFPAFAPEKIGITLGIYAIALGVLLFSVKSYIFEREEGVGLTTEKLSKGYSRWAKEKDIKSDPKIAEVNVYDKKTNAAGIPLIIKDDKLYVDNGEYHTLVIGSTGSGKTQTVIFPTVKILARHGESMIITDPKGEIYEETGTMLRKRGYQVLVLNFRDPQKGNSWNPMSLPYELYKKGNQDKSIELLDDLALNILYDSSNKNSDPFWEKTAADYFAGVALGLFEDAKPEEININSISLATTVGEEKFGGSTFIKEYFAEKDPNSAAAIDASATIMAPDETKDSILSVFKQKIKLFASRENLSEMLSYSDIDLESIGEKKTAVFIVIQDEKKTYHALATILLKQIYETLIAVAQRHGGHLPIRTNFLLDEFANMPPLKDVTTMITAARSRHIRFTMIIQNFAQLDQVYGKEEAETIRGNCGNLIYLLTTELKALEEISKMCGEVKSKKDDKTASTPLVTVSDLQRMKQFDVIILRTRLQPFKTHFTPNFKLDWGDNYPPTEYPTRQKRKVQTFDIKEFVRQTKKKKLLEMMNKEKQEGTDGGAGSTRAMMERQTGMSSRRPLPSNLPSNFGPPIATSERPREEIRPIFEKKEDETPIRPNIQFPTPSENRVSSPPIRKPMPSFEDDDNDDFDVDELVRKIDAKIAELEREEREEKEREAKARTRSGTAPKKDTIQVEQTAPKIETNEIKTNTNTNIVKEIKEPDLTLDEEEDDDDFFDDFFDN